MTKRSEFTSHSIGFMLNSRWPTSRPERGDRKRQLPAMKALSVITRAVFWKIRHKTEREDIRLKLGRYKKPAEMWDDEVLDSVAPKSELTLDNEEFLSLIAFIREKYEPFRQGVKAFIPLVLDEWFTRQGYSSKDSEFDLIYVNGDNNLENLKAPDDTWKVRLIEEDFHRLMFNTAGA